MARPTKADRAEVLRRAATERPVDIARDMGVAPSTIQRVLMDAKWGPTGLWALDGIDHRADLVTSALLQLWDAIEGGDDGLHVRSAAVLLGRPMDPEWTDVREHLTRLGFGWLISPT